MIILMPYYLTAQNIHVPGTKNNLHPDNFCLSIVKWKLKKYGSQDIITIGVASLTKVHNIKSHIPLLRDPGFFYCGWDLYLIYPFKSSIQIHYFQEMTCSLGSEVYTHPAITGGKICAGFWPSSSIVYFPCISRPLFIHELVGN